MLFAELKGRGLISLRRAEAVRRRGFLSLAFGKSGNFLIRAISLRGMLEGAGIYQLFVSVPDFLMGKEVFEILILPGK